VAGGGWWWSVACKPILVFSFDFSQAEQYLTRQLSGEPVNAQVVANVLSVHDF
jgi:hypothetical protein